MKSYFLGPVAADDKLTETLDSVLSRQADTWILKDTKDDPIAYFYSATIDGEKTIQADISGRHFDRDKDIIQILEKLKQTLGGEISGDT